MLTQSELKDNLRYDPDTGLFTWRVNRQSVKAGDTAGCVRQRGYIAIRLYGIEYRAHRLAFLWMLGEWPKHVVDHIDRDTSNNKWSNLRDVEYHVNSHNNGSSGVTFVKRIGKWQAQCRFGGKNHYLGVFTSKDGAIAARNVFRESRLSEALGVMPA